MAPRHAMHTSTRDENLWKDFMDRVKGEMSKDEELNKNLEELRKRTTDATERLSSDGRVSGARDAASRVTAKASSAVGSVGSKVGSVVGSAASRVAKTAQSTASHAKSKVESNANVSAARDKVKAKVSETSSTVAKSKAAARIVDIGKKGLEAAREMVVEEVDDLSMRREYSTSDKAPGVKGSALVLAEAEKERPLNMLMETKVGKKVKEIGTKISESDNAVVRATRETAYRIKDTASALSDRFFPESETAVCFREILRLDKHFDENQLRRRLEKFILPDVMKALARSDVNALKPLVAEKLHQVFERTVDPSLGAHQQQHIMDLSPLEFVDAKIVDKEPTLYFTFVAQTVPVQYNAVGEIIPDSVGTDIKSTQYVWAVQRDRNDPTVWQLAEMQAYEEEDVMF